MRDRGLKIVSQTECQEPRVAIAVASGKSPHGVRKISVDEQDLIELAQQAREAAIRFLNEEAYWLQLLEDQKASDYISTVVYCE